MSDWSTRAPCKGITAFTPPDGVCATPEAIQRWGKPLLKICNSCPFVTQCLERVRPRSSQFDGVAGGRVWSDGRVVDRLRHLPAMARSDALPRQRVCGTEAGARAHTRRGETACPSCRQAANTARAARAARAARKAKQAAGTEPEDNDVTSYFPEPPPLRAAMAPLLAGAVLAAEYPNLTSNAIEIVHLHADRRELGLGLRVFLYRPDPTLRLSWFDAIGAHGGTHTETSQPGEVSTTVHGNVQGTPIEVVCLDGPARPGLARTGA